MNILVASYAKLYYFYCMKNKNIDYTLVEEYLDSLLEDDPGMLMNGITQLYRRVSKRFRPIGRKRGHYSWASISQAVRDYYCSKHVDPKILVKMNVRELHSRA